MGLIRGILPTWTEAPYGSGSGYGDGDGSGSGSGDGSGYGDGSGSGYGDGDGSGSGSGDGSGYWGAVADSMRSKWENVLGFIAFWKSDKNGYPSNGGTAASVAKPGHISKCNPPLKLCGPHALHATLNPDKWKGERLWIVALRGDVLHEEDKVGALEREIICEVK